MTATEAAKLLEIAPDATPEQLEARFLELRRKLEDKIAKAPTPGLQAKYRESLAQITTAFEFLTLAADSSALPVLKKETGDRKPETGATSSREVSSGNSVSSSAVPQSALRTPQSPKKSNREFLIVALIAVAVLGAGGWFVMKSRAEAAERTRIAAAEKAEHDRKVAEEHRLAEAARLAAEAEKARLAAAEKAEQQRLETLTGQLRGELAEYKIGWEAIEREERNAERRLGELKSDLRSLREASPGQMAEAQANVAAQQSYSDWLGEILPQHPAKVARSKAEELLSARQPDAAQAALAEVKVAVAELNQSIRKTRERLLDLDGELLIRTDEDVSWTLSDAFGRTRSGRGSAQLDGIAVGYGRIQLTKPRWPAREEKFLVRRDQPVEVIAEHKSQTLKLRTNPAGAEVRLDDGKVLGTTPLAVEGFPPGTLTVSLSLEGYYDVQQKLTLPSTEADGPMLALKVKPTGLVKPDRWSSPSRVSVENNIAMTGGATNNSRQIEEWDLAQPNPTLGWTQITRKFVLFTGTNAQYAPVAGSMMRQQRQPDGSWLGTFTQGGLADSSLNHIWERTTAALWQVHLGFLDIWPESEVVVGGTWPVKPAVFFPMLGFTNATGQATAKLLALEREDDGDRAVIEFAYNYTVSGMNGQSTLKVFVNLTEGYVTRTEGRDALNTGTSTIYNNYSTAVTKR